VVFEEGVTEISDEAFGDPYGLDSALEQITFPESLRKIGKSAFAKTKVRSVTIPAGVEFIDQYAFENCESLETVMISKSTKYGSTVFPAAAKITKY
jgi:hypothetical protein